MKKTIFIIAAMFAMAQVCNATSDTVTVIENPSQVIITETPNGVKVNVQGSKDDESANYSYSVEHQANDKVITTQEKDWEIRYPFSKNDSKGHWAIIMDGFYMGGGISHSWDMINNSFEIGLLDIAAINYDSHHGQDISLGVGIHHKSFSLKRPNMLVRDEATSVVSPAFYPDGVELKDRSSNLNMWALQFPLMFRQKIYKSFAIRFGGIMNWNYLAQVNNNYNIGKSEYQVKLKGLKQNKITFDLMGGLSLGHIGIYCRYSPNEVFKKGYGPEIKNTWTLGGTIAF
jgi:hypothetical protein